MEELKYPDLPAWAQPGQKAARSGNSGTEIVTVSHVTKTQIVTKDSHGFEHRFERAGKQPSDTMGERGWTDVRFRERGGKWNDLCSPEEPRVHAALLRAALTNAVRQAWDAGARAQDQSRQGKKKAPQNLSDLEQWAIEELDGLDHALREARQKIEKAAQRHRERASLHRSW